MHRKVSLCGQTKYGISEPSTVQDLNQQFKRIYFLKKIAFTPIGNGVSLSSNEILGLDSGVIFETFLVV